MRGIYEKPVDSGIWWIHYYVGGKRHREKVGRKSDAIKLYQSRKADTVAGRKLPELRNSKIVTLAELIDDALEFVAHHKDNRSYKSKAAIVSAGLGSQPAADLTPQELERWLRGYCKTPATSNRYKALSHSATAKASATGRSPSIPLGWYDIAGKGPDACAFSATRNMTACIAWWRDDSLNTWRSSSSASTLA